MSTSWSVPVLSKDNIIVNEKWSRTGQALLRRQRETDMPEPLTKAKHPVDRDILWYVAAFIIGFGCSIFISFVGELYVGEIGLAGIAFIWFSRSPLHWDISNRALRWATVLLLLMLGALVFADIYNGSAPDDYLRGWSRVVLLIVDMLAISGLAVGRDSRRFLWYMFGSCVGGVVVPLVTDHSLLANWKFGGGVPCTLLIALLICFRLSWVWQAVILTCVGTFNIYMDFRSLGGICVAAALFCFVRSHRSLGLRAMYFPLIVAIACSGLFTWDLLQWSSSSDTDTRRAESNEGRYMSIVIALEAISDSPLVGHGSWPRSRAYADTLADHSTEFALQQDADDADLIPAHSMILQGWLEAGLLGAVFFSWYIGSLLAAIARLMVRDTMGNFSPFVFTFLILALWDALFSPFAGIHRFDVAIGIALIAYQWREMHQSAAPSPEPLPAAEPALALPQLRVRPGKWGPTWR